MTGTTSTASGSNVEPARGERRRGATSAPSLSSDTVWGELDRASFAIISYVTPAGEPRSSGVVYGVHERHLYVVVAPDSWKARQIADGQPVAVTVPVRRGGLLSLFAPIPPATITFRARARVYPAGSLDPGSVSKKLQALLPKDRREATVLELVPEATFLTYGIGVSLLAMRDPAVARAHIPVASADAAAPGDVG
jgi:hypothetical protein